MYRLLIKAYGSDIFEVADLSKINPAMTFEMNDIGNAEDAQANYSQRITLPMTATNRRIFGNIDSNFVRSKMPYKTLEARLFVDNFTLIGKGGICRVLTVNENDIEVCLMSGIRSVFYEIEHLDFVDTEFLGKPKMPMGVNDDLSFIAYYQNTHYVFAQYNVSEFLTNYDVIGNYIQNCMPLVWLWHQCDDGSFVGLIPAIADALGITIDTTIDRSVINNYALTLCEPLNNNTGAIVEDRENIRNAKTDGANISFQNFNYKVISWGEKIFTVHRSIVGFKINLDVASSTYVGFNMAVLFDGKPDGKAISFDVENHSDSPIDWDFYKWQKSGNRYLKSIIVRTDGVVLETDGNGNYFTAATHDVLKTYKDGDDFKIIAHNYADAISGDLLVSYGVVYIEDTKSNSAISGSSINVSKSLGFENAKEALKTFMQLFGLFPIFNYATKTLSLINMSLIKGNKNSALDWTEKLVGNVKRTFVIDGYGQTNNILFSENEQNQQDKISFYIADDNLDPEKDLLTLKIETGRGYLIQQLNDTGTQFKKSKKPHLVILDKDNDADGYPIDNYYHVNRHVSPQDLTHYYDALSDIINDAECVEADFLLTNYDISTLDLTKPIYLRQFGRHFYINSVQNYISGQVTTCTLIAI